MTSFAEAFARGGDVLACDFDLVCEELSLGAPGKARLAASVTGFLPGNRDKPLFDLCSALARIDPSAVARRDYPYVMFTSESGGLLRSLDQRALLMFLLEMDSRAHFERVLDLCSDLIGGTEAASRGREERISEATRQFARLFYEYRSSHLPFASARDRFIAIQAFMAERLGRKLPIDGDALLFWSENAGSANWALLEGAACRFADFRFAVETALAASGIASAASLDQLVAVTATVDASRSDEAAGGGEYDLENTETGRKAGLAGNAWASVTDETDIAAAIEEVAASPLRILSARDTANLQRLSRLCGFNTDWPRTTIDAIGFGNIQNRIVQALRTGALDDPSDFLADGQHEIGFEEAVKLYSGIGLVTKQALRLAYDSRGGSEAKRRKEEMGRTIVLPEADRLVRRASIASRSRRDIHRELMKLVPALYSLNAWLDTVLRGWTHWTSGKRHALEQDWLTFSATIKESYAQEGGRAAHRQESAAKAGRSAGWNDPARDGYPNPEYGSR